MYYAYVLKSLKFDFYYKGHCGNIEQRLKEHNAGMTKSIKPYIPFQVVYFEESHTPAEAIAKEKYLKTAAGRKYYLLSNFVY